MICLYKLCLGKKLKILMNDGLKLVTCLKGLCLLMYCIMGIAVSMGGEVVNYQP